MGQGKERTAAQWYEEAARWYVEGHQACPACGGRHCVFRSERGGRVEYLCSECDFAACRDRKTGLHYHSPGEEKATGAAPTFRLTARPHA